MNESRPSSNSRSDLWKAIGPGILVACAAIGGSHLLWSTKAGAEFGWSLLGLVLLANLFKFPFFLYGQRYTAATGESLLAGYHRKGPVYVVIFLFINVLTGAINIAAVAMLGGALLSGFDLFAFPVGNLTVGILIFCALLVLLGHYRFLDGMAKFVIVALVITTLVAVAMAGYKGPVAEPGFTGPSPWNWATFGFLIVLIGWMPAPIDLSAWSSLWMFSRGRQTGHFATVRETSIDFYTGYLMAVVMAVAFLALGALVMFGSGETFSPSGAGFASQLVHLYSVSIGDWSRPLILAAAFITMFSTAIATVDGYPRSLAACCSLLLNLPQERFRQIHYTWIVVSVVAASAIVLFFVDNLFQLLGFAAAVSFITSPVLAWINYRVMSGPNVPGEDRPGPVLRWLSWAGIGFFILMTLGYLYVTFVM